MGTWLDLSQIWATTTGTTTTYTTTTSQETEYINYDSFYYNYIQEDKGTQDFASISTAEVSGLFNGLFSPAISTAEASGLFDCFNPIEITTPIKRRGAKMG